jgi:hypothetical protein
MVERAAVRQAISRRRDSALAERRSERHGAPPWAQRVGGGQHEGTVGEHVGRFGFGQDSTDVPVTAMHGRHVRAQQGQIEGEWMSRATTQPEGAVTPAGCTVTAARNVVQRLGLHASLSA